MLYTYSEEIKDVNASSKSPCSIGSELTEEEEEKNIFVLWGGSEGIRGLFLPYTWKYPCVYFDRFIEWEKIP